MWTNLKDTLQKAFKWILDNLALLVVGLVGLVVLLFASKNEEIEKLKSKLGLVDTQRKADLLEAEIKQRMDHKDTLDKENKQLASILTDLQQKRTDLQKGADLTPEEVEDFWKKN